MITTRKSLACCFASVLALVSVAGGRATGSTGAPPPMFSIKSIGYLPGGLSSSAAAINDLGQVTGSGSTYRANFRRQDDHPGEAFLYSKGKLTKLGLVPGSQGTSGVAINNSGLVAVSVERADQQGHLLAYLARVSGGLVIWTRLPEPKVPYPYGSPSGLNGHGTVVGQSPAVDYSHAMVWRPSGTGYRFNRARVSLSHVSSLAGVDNQGDMVGTDYGLSWQFRHALLWVGGSSTPIDLSCEKYGGSPLGKTCRKFGRGEPSAVARYHLYSVTIMVAGERETAGGRQRAIEWELNLAQSWACCAPPMHETLLPLLSGFSASAATAVSTDGSIVGQMERFAGGYAVRHARSGSARPAMGSYVPGPAVLWLWPKGKVYNLNDLIPRNSGWNLQQATSINCRGQIVGNGMYHGRSTGFVLTPR